MGKNIRDLLSAEQNELAVEALEKAFIGGKPQAVELKFSTSSGQQQWYAIRIGQVKQGIDVTSLTVIMTEVTAQKEAQEEIRQLNESLEVRVKERTEQLESANKELEAFSYSVSHDLQAPLRAINGFSKILMGEFSGNLPGESRDFLERIQSSVQRMDRLIDDLLNFSRTSRQVIKRSPVELTSLAQQVFNELYEENRNRRTIVFSLTSLPTTNVDYALFHQVFENLLSNAIKYTQSRTIAKIEVGSLEKEGEQVIFVRDNGAGFDMQNADKLFGVFQRLHRNEEFEGTGIGLATVQRIINRHGGRMWAESKQDEGATFYFTIG